MGLLVYISLNVRFIEQFSGDQLQNKQELLTRHRSAIKSGMPFHSDP